MVTRERVWLYAVIQTGAYTPSGDVISFRDSGGARCPSILFTHKDRIACEKRRKRLLLTLGRIQHIGEQSNHDNALSTPVLGVVPILVEQPVKRERKPETTPPSTNGTTTPAPTPAPTDEQLPSKRARKHHAEATPSAS